MGEYGSYGKIWSPGRVNAPGRELVMKEGVSMHSRVLFDYDFNIKLIEFFQNLY